MWKILLAFTLFVFLNLSAVDAAQDKASETDKQEQQRHTVEDQIIVPPFELPEKDVINMKDKVQRLKPIIEKDQGLSRVKITDMDEVPGIIPKVHLAYGYGSVLNLPFSFSADDVAIGAREKFNIEIKDGSLVIFPLKEFKTTNLIIFEKKSERSVPHHYLLIEDGTSGEADLTVNIKRRDIYDLTCAADAMVRIITTQQLPEKGSIEDVLLEGRSPSLTRLDTYPFIRMMSLAKPELYVFMIAGKVTPVGNADFWLDLGNSTSIIASRHREMTIRRIIDGKTFKYVR